MKKISKILTLLLGTALCLAACNRNTAEIGVVIDVGLLNDGGFNQGTYEGCKQYAEANGKTYQYYQPANGVSATEQDRITALETAIKNGAKIILAPGFLFADSIGTVAIEHPDTKFVFIDGWSLGKANITAISYQEEQSGYLAGYAAVKEGYTKLGGVFGGAGTSPACNRFAYGYVQGANKAAQEDSKTVEVKISFLYGGEFVPSLELKTLTSSWYNTGTEIIFSCGGAMIDSVIAAAEESTNGKVIGVDVDQSKLSPRVITSAVKGITPSVVKVLGQYYDGKWDSVLADKCQNLGASDNAIGLPTADESWRFATFTKTQYEQLFNSMKNGEVTISNNAGDVLTQQFWTTASSANCSVTLVA